MEQNYSEKLREQPIAGVKAILDYSKEQIEKIEWEQISSPQESKYYNKASRYWSEVMSDCEQELELRIKQIFP